VIIFISGYFGLIVLVYTTYMASRTSAGHHQEGCEVAGVQRMHPKPRQQRITETRLAQTWQKKQLTSTFPHTVHSLPVQQTALVTFYFLF